MPRESGNRCRRISTIYFDFIHHFTGFDSDFTERPRRFVFVAGFLTGAVCEGALASDFASVTVARRGAAIRSSKRCSNVWRTSCSAASAVSRASFSISALARASSRTSMAWPSLVCRSRIVACASAKLRSAVSRACRSVLSAFSAASKRMVGDLPVAGCVSAACCPLSRRIMTMGTSPSCTKRDFGRSVAYRSPERAAGIECA